MLFFRTQIEIPYSEILTVLLKELSDLKNMMNIHCDLAVNTSIV